MCMGLCAVPVLLIVGGSNISSKILLFTERNCSFIMPTFVMMPLFEESLFKLNQMSFITLPVKVMWESVLRFRKSPHKRLPIVRLNYLRYAEIRITRLKSTWLAHLKSLEMQAKMPKMKILFLTLLLPMGWLKPSVCKLVIFTGDLPIICL